jgi:hypothetical protein
MTLYIHVYIYKTKYLFSKEVLFHNTNGQKKYCFTTQMAKRSTVSQHKWPKEVLFHNTNGQKKKYIQRSTKHTYKTKE